MLPLVPERRARASRATRARAAGGRPPLVEGEPATVEAFVHPLLRFVTVEHVDVAAADERAAVWVSEACLLYTSPSPRD